MMIMMLVVMDDDDDDDVDDAGADGYDDLGTGDGGCADGGREVRC